MIGYDTGRFAGGYLRRAGGWQLRASRQAAAVGLPMLYGARGALSGAGLLARRRWAGIALPALFALLTPLYVYAFSMVCRWFFGRKTKRLYSLISENHSRRSTAGFYIVCTYQVILCAHAAARASSPSDNGPSDSSTKKPSGGVAMVAPFFFSSFSISGAA